MEYGYVMTSAYNVVPSAMYLVYWAFSKKRMKYWLLLLPLAFFSVVIYGTRGPLLALVIYAIFCFFLNVAKEKNILKMVMFIILGLAIVSFLQGELFLQLVENLSEFFSKKGFSTRILDKFLEKEMADDSGRSIIYDLIIVAIKENQIFGLGLMGDRIVLNGTYAHNLFLEILCSFGLPFGILIVCIVLYIPLKALIKTASKEEFYFVVLLITLVFTKLMLSGSFVIEPYFSFMLGVCIAANRKYEKKGMLDYEKRKFRQNY